MWLQYKGFTFVHGKTGVTARRKGITLIGQSDVELLMVIDAVTAHWGGAIATKEYQTHTDKVWDLDICGGQPRKAPFLQA